MPLRLQQRRPARMVHNGRLPIILLGYCCILLSYCRVTAYPVIVQVPEESDRCLRLNIPQDDDSHLLFLVLPSPDEDDNIESGSVDQLEAWYVDQVYKMTKLKSQHEVLPKKLPDNAPTEVAQTMSNYLKVAKQGNQSPLRILISDKPIVNSGPPIKQQTYKNPGQVSYNTKYFAPLVINYVRKLTRSRPQRWEDAQLEGYGICLINDDPDNQVQVVFDSILVSEDIEDDDTLTKETLDKDRHLTPLEQTLDQSISAAQTVLREMKFLELREARMRQTAESINSRVRWFSYLSVGVLLLVTYVQVTYLKRYFRKKKLM